LGKIDGFDVRLRWEIRYLCMLSARADILDRRRRYWPGFVHAPCLLTP
jgi:hypothetical protein